MIMKRIITFVTEILFITLSAIAGGPRALFISDSITDGNWGNSCGTAKPSSERTLWDMNHISTAVIITDADLNLYNIWIISEPSAGIPHPTTTLLQEVPVFGKPKYRVR